MVESRRGHQWMSIAAVLVVILFLTSCGGDGTGYPIPVGPISTESPSPPDEPTPTAEPSPPDEPSPTAEPSASPSPDENQTGQTWTVMLYFDLRDEITEKWSLFDVNEAESIGSDNRVRIVAQVARYSGGNTADGDWSGARRYLLQPDDDMEAIRSPLLVDLGEVNMANEDTLVDFVQWSAQNYPADHYALVMLDHGAGWPGGYLDRDSGGIGRDNIALAEQRGDLLFTMEIGRALERLRQAGLPSLDLIGFDACLMASLEVFVEVAPYARYAVASQNVENSSTAWAYAAWLKDLRRSRYLRQPSGPISDFSRGPFRDGRSPLRRRLQPVRLWHHDGSGRGDPVRARRRQHPLRGGPGGAADNAGAVEPTRRATGQR